MMAWYDSGDGDGDKDVDGDDGSGGEDVMMTKKDHDGDDEYGSIMYHLKDEK